MAENLRTLSPKLQKVANDEQRSPGRVTVRTFTNWTPAKVRAAEQQADSGNLFYAASICEWLLGDEAVASGLESRSQALLGLTPTFEPLGDKRRSTAVTRALDDGKDYWRGYHESELEQLVAWRLLLGVAPGRHAWTAPLPEHGGRVLPNLEFWHPQNLSYDFNVAGWFGKDAQGLKFPIVPGDGIWVLHALTKFRPWSRGLWRSLARWVIFKWLAAQDYSRHSEKGAMLVAFNDQEQPIGDLAEQRKHLAEDLKNSGEDAVIVLRAGWKLDILEIAANTKQIYEAQIELANRAIAIRIRGGNLTTNVDQAGSKAATETQAKSNEAPKLKFDGEGLSTTIRDQSLIWWAEFNFGDPRLAPYPKYPTDPPEDKKSKAEVVKIASEGAETLDKIGFIIDEKEFSEDFGFTWIKGRKTDEQRAAEKKAAQPAIPEDGEPTEEDDGEPGSAKDTGKKAPKGIAFALASGAAVSKNRGFVEGQLYIDALTDNSTADGIEALDETRKAILEELDAATDFGDLRDRLTARYAEMSAEEISDLVWKAMTMARLAGHRAVNQDA
jgi:phage gp29-like protein